MWSTFEPGEFYEANQRNQQDRSQGCLALSDRLAGTPNGSTCEAVVVLRDTSAL